MHGFIEGAEEKAAMNHRERILAAVRRQPVDRVPTDIWATAEVIQKLMDYFRITEGGISSRGK